MWDLYIIFLRCGFATYVYLKQLYIRFLLICLALTPGERGCFPRRLSRMDGLSLSLFLINLCGFISLSKTPETVTTKVVTSQSRCREQKLFLWRRFDKESAGQTG